MGKKVPNCNECEYCKSVFQNYKNFYCIICEDRNLGVDYAPSRSPKWCPKRSMDMRKLHISKLFDKLYLKDKLFVVTLYHEFHNDISTDVCKKKLLQIIARFESYGIRIWGDYKYELYGSDKYTLEYNSIIHYLEFVLDHYVCEKYGYTTFMDSKDYINGSLYEYYDSLLI